VLADLVLSPGGQRVFESLGRVPAGARVSSALDNFPFTMIDPVTVLDEAEKWEKLWNGFFLKK
jgi:iron(III) transport system substrate-binding protein